MVVAVPAADGQAAETVLEELVVVDMEACMVEPHTAEPGRTTLAAVVVGE